MATTNRATGVPIPGTTFISPWGGTGAADPYAEWRVDYPPQASPTPDCNEAITILEEAEYELKELLKKTPATVNVGSKSPQDYIETALRSVQAALRALLKI